MGELSNQAARMRTQDVHDVIATDECKGILRRSSKSRRQLAAHAGCQDL
jgi:hypothetical protein